MPVLPWPRLCQVSDPSRRNSNDTGKALSQTTKHCVHWSHITRARVRTAAAWHLECLFLCFQLSSTFLSLTDNETCSKCREKTRGTEGISCRGWLQATHCQGRLYSPPLHSCLANNIPLHTNVCFCNCGAPLLWPLQLLAGPVQDSSSQHLPIQWVILASGQPSSSLV